MINLAKFEFIDIAIVISFSAACLALIVAGILFLLKSKGKNRRLRIYFMGIALFLFLYGINRAIRLLFEATLEPTFLWQMTVEEFNALIAKDDAIYAAHDLMWVLTLVIGSVGGAFLLFVIELHIMERKTKFLFTITKIITTIPPIFLGYRTDEVLLFRIMLYIGDFLLLSIPIFYYYLASKTSGETRKKAIMAGTGLLLFFVSIAINSSLGKTILGALLGLPGVYLTYFLFSALVILGILIYTRSIAY